MSKKQKQGRSTFRFPFDIDRRIFLVLACFFLLISIKPINKLFFPRFDVITLKKNIERSYNIQKKEFDNLLNEKKTLELFAQSALSSTEIEHLNNKNWGLSIYKNNKLLAWSNERLLTNFIPPKENTAYAYNDQGAIGVAIIKKLTLHSEEYIVQGTFPLYIKYRNENKFLKSRFNINNNNEIETDDYGHYLKIIVPNNPTKALHPIELGDNAKFSLLEKNDILDIYDKNPWHFFFAALPFIFFGISIHTFFKVSVRRNPMLYFSLLLFVAIIIRVLNYAYAFPDDFSEFQLFNPDLYANGIANRSLGDIFINQCLIFWILLFFLINIQFKTYPKHNKTTKIFAGIISLVFLFWIAFQSLAISKSLVFDSILNYDTTNYNNITFEKFIGLVTFLIIFTNYVVAIIICHKYLERCTPIRGLRYLLLLILPLINFFFSTPLIFNEILVLSAWASLFFFLLDSKYMETKFDFNSYRLLYWIIFLTVSCSLMFNYFTFQKEKTDRINIGNKFLNFESPVNLDNITNLKNELKKNELIEAIFTNNSAYEIRKITNLLDLAQLNFGQTITLEPIINSQTKDDDISNYIKNKKSQLVNAKDNVYLNSTFGKETYTAILKNPDLNKTCAGIAIKSERALSLNDNNQLSLNYNSISNTAVFENNYEIGFYENGICTYQIGNTNFPFKLNSQTTKNKSNYYFKNEDLSTNTLVLYDKTDTRNRVLLIRKHQNIFYQFSTSYAIIFTLIFLIISLYILGNIVARSNFRWSRFIALIGLTLRMRIHLAILSVELIAFVLIGFISIYYYSLRSRNSIEQDTVLSSTKLSSNLNASSFLTSIIQSENKFTLKEPPIINRELLGQDFNIYSLQGKLIYTTDRTKINAQIYTNRINPLAWYDLKYNLSQNSIRTEQLGDYEYLSAYNYLRDQNNQPLCILQTPNLNAHNRTKKEIANLIISLINIYTIIFLLSSIIAFFITRRLTKSFTAIVSQFSKINLTKTNKPLDWPYSDEIGLLVKEYNRTLLKLENNTALLAKSERESAWREMAKQIAHEIKNPLTPMSLSLQTLQNAIKRDDPNLKEKTIRMTKTVLEQINVLTRISSNFAQFAKMSDIDAREESLREIIKSSTGIYTDNENAEFLFILPDKEIKVFVDKVKLIRVLTNIIQNALQAVPTGTIAYITLTVSKIKANLIRVSISDNGEGIPNDLAVKIFEPKFTTKSSGSGLGLAMSKDIMNKTGGDITFETTMGKGTTFHIDIPVFIPNTDIEEDESLDDFWEEN